MTPTIKQRTIAVPLSQGNTATVRRLAWKAHKDLLRQIPAAIKRLGLFDLRGATVEQLVDKLPEIIATTDELIDFILAHATDVPREVAESDLDALDIGQLVSAAVRLNFDAELKNSWAGIGSALTSLFQADAAADGRPTETPPGSTSTPASSMPATPPTT